MHKQKIISLLWRRAWDFRPGRFCVGRGVHWTDGLYCLGWLVSASRTWPLGFGEILGGGGIVAVDSVDWATWALGGWHGYAVRDRINYVCQETEDIFLGGRGISAVVLFSGVWALDGICWVGWD